MKKLFFIAVGLTLLQLQILGQKSALSIEESDGSNPWNNLNINAKPGQFQFAIITDRTGGHRPGVFMEGIRRLNLLQPEFVMSVGDLIEGYTEDLDQLNFEWDQFNGFIDSLTMPFFYVPGNHDITNQVMQDLWIKKFGRTYYHFVYNDVLFLCLNSEDQYRGAGRGTIAKDQYAYIKETLAKNSNVKWTLVFMHQPLWSQKNAQGWSEVEALLANRKHTVFTGHVHHYAKYNRNNGKYFTLGTTGGGSSLRGPQLGEFDHVSWITMTENGPIMANLQLEGIWDENVSTEKTRAYANEVWRSNPIQIEPLYTTEDQFTKGIAKIKITNDKDIPMVVKLKESFSWDLLSSLEQNEITVGPNSVEFVDLELIGKKRAKAVEQIKAIKLKAQVRHVDQGLPVIEIPFSFHIAPEKKYVLSKVTGEVKVDGNLEDWASLPYSIDGDKAEDASAKFGLCYDDKYIYLAAKVLDDHLQTDTSAAAWVQDNIGFVINMDPLKKSAVNNGTGWYRESLYLLHAPANGGFPSITNQDKIEESGILSVCKATKGGYLMESAIPIKHIKDRQGENWKTFRLNIAVQDKDPNEPEMKTYSFKPNWRGKENRVGSGMFFRK